ncbi:YwhD family protein [Bacillus sp. 165]|uniref:YwhD family protein n=1 Tax=Bacillus sp. 165 TaxID=1529117 RepID=UPI001ADAC531|nr:YwhD family protein [Bacillus sp. 165]MBO9130121.1 YwhD family protein [Bacillus sp. 165]
MEEQPKKKAIGFNILKNDSTSGHGGFGVGALSLENISPVFIDVTEGEAFVDIGAMHARSVVEKGIKFLANKDEVPNGKPYWLVWVTIERTEKGAYYAGATACEMTVDREIRRGYKSLPEHVNKMDKSLKRHILVDHMDEKSKHVLAQFLKNHDESMWNLSSEKLKTDLLNNE